MQHAGTRHPNRQTNFVQQLDPTDGRHLGPNAARFHPRAGGVSAVERSVALRGREQIRHQTEVGRGTQRDRRRYLNISKMGHLREGR